MIRTLRRKFVIITMSLLVVVATTLFTISYFYNSYWDDEDSYRIVTVIAKNGYLKDYSNEAIAFVIIDSDRQVSIKENTTSLEDADVKQVSLSLLKQGERKWKSGQYIYSLSRLPNHDWQLVFIDLDSYAVSYNQIALTIIFTLFGFSLLTVVSLYLSRFIIKPTLVSINREKQFVSDASHELKSPIAAIRANAQVLQHQIGSNQYLDHILSEARGMEELVQSLLGLARLDREDLASSYEQVDFSSICEEVAMVYESLAFEEGKDLEAEIEEAIYTKGNKTQLKQLVTILIDNAIKHSLDNSDIQIKMHSNKKEVVLQVSNQSSIYSEDEIGNLFERFYRSENSRHDSESYGLGLSIAKVIVERHGGTITAWQSNGRMYFEVHLSTIRRTIS